MNHENNSFIVILDVKSFLRPFHHPQTCCSKREKEKLAEYRISPLTHNLDRRNTNGLAQNKTR
jgi:hypothetical protein